MNVASLELSKTLFELSRWSYPGMLYYLLPDDDVVVGWLDGKDSVPAYDLGYLLRKLSTVPVKLRNKRTGQWAIAFRTGGYNEKEYLAEADTPEDAACRLAIELFKKGVLRKELG